MSFATPLLWVLLSGGILFVVALIFTLRTQKSDLVGWQKVLLQGSHWLAALSLWMLLCQPQRPQPPDVETILITPGVPAGVSSTAASGAVTLDDFNLHPLHQAVPTASRLRVLGYGLPLDQWRGTDATLVLQPPALPAGLVDVHWPGRIILGETLEFSARLNQMPDAAQVQLLAPGDVLLSQAVIGTDGAVSLSQIPPSPGPLTLTVAIRNVAGELILRHPLPVLVEPAVGPRVLIALGRLSFEARDLQRWLAQTTPGLRLAARVGTQVQRMLQTAEAPALDTWRTDPNALDLMVVDATWLSQRRAIEIAQLARAVVGGMGLLVLADEAASGLTESPLLDGFILSAADPLPIPLRVGDKTLIVDAIGLTAGAGERLLAAADSQRAPALVRRLGGGRIVLSLMHNSYTLNTRGQGEEYAQAWQTLVAAAARALPATRWIEAPLPVMHQGEVVKRCEAQQCTRQTLNTAGWNNLDGIWHYAFAADDWRAYRAQVVTQQSALAAQLRSDASDVLVRSENYPQRWLLWLVFALSSGWIWLQQKFQ